MSKEFELKSTITVYIERNAMKRELIGLNKTRDVSQYCDYLRMRIGVYQTEIDTREGNS